MPSKTTEPAATGLAFNHAMIYSRDVAAAIHFYGDLLGFEILEEVKTPRSTVYARLKSPGSDTTIALHALPPGQELHTGGVRLYFEVKELEKFCQRLEEAGVKFSAQPKVMPWGWTHAYLDDPDGHEVSLYKAGEQRLHRTAAST